MIFLKISLFLFCVFLAAKFTINLVYKDADQMSDRIAVIIGLMMLSIPITFLIGLFGVLFL